MLSIGSSVLGTALADSNGRFSTSINPGQLPVGSYSVVAACGGARLPASLNVVLVSRVSQGTSSLVILIFFVLIAIAGIRRQFDRR